MINFKFAILALVFAQAALFSNGTLDDSGSVEIQSVLSCKDCK